MIGAGIPSTRGARPIVVRVVLRLEDLNHLDALIFKLGNHARRACPLARARSGQQHASLVACIDRIASGCRHAIIGGDTDNIDELDTALIQPLHRGVCGPSSDASAQARARRLRPHPQGREDPQTRVGCFEAALAEVRLMYGVQVLVNLRTFALGDAVHRPGAQRSRGVSEKCEPCIDMPVLGGGNRVVAVVVLHVFANQRGNVRTALGGEGAAGAEIVLHVNEDQQLRHVCLLGRGMSYLIRQVKKQYLRRVV